MYYILTDLAVAVDVTAVCGIIDQHLEPGFVFEGERHDFWEFIYVEDGEITVMCGDYEYVLKKNELSFHMPGEFHSVRAETRQAHIVTFSFVCKSEFMRRFENRIMYVGQGERRLISDIVEEVSRCLKTTTDHIPYHGMRVLDGMPEAGLQVIKNMLEIILIMLARRAENSCFNTRKIFKNKYNSDIVLLNLIMKYLDANVDKTLTVSEIASYVGVGATIIKRLAREHLGCGIINYFNLLKIERAKRYIDKSDCNFSQIADKLGYSSIQYFSSSFKRATGLTPSEYSKRDADGAAV